MSYKCFHIDFPESDIPNVSVVSKEQPQWILFLQNGAEIEPTELFLPNGSSSVVSVN